MGLNSIVAKVYSNVQPRWVVGAYLLFQSTMVVLWWLGLFFIAGAIEWFQPADWPKSSLLGFWLSDLGLLGLGSLVTGVAVWGRVGWARTALWMLTGASIYPALYCLGVSLMTGQAWLASALMVSMSGLTFSMATIIGYGDQGTAAIRSIQLSPRVALIWTMLQLIIFWAVFLLVIPLAIVEVEVRLGWPPFTHVGQVIGSQLLFAFASSLGVWSAVATAWLGRGTPLPTATSPLLITQGPYRYVRNPMAVAGILQGLAVGWLLGAVSVICYSICGALVWHVFVRPVEELDLEARFGESYSLYKSNVRLWVPQLPSRSQLNL